MNPFKKIIQGSCSILPTNLLTKLSGTRVLLPYHHIVSDESLPHIREMYRYKNRKKFIRDIDWLLKKFKPLHPNNLAEHFFSGTPFPERSFLLSFDDGFREVHDIVAPILAEKGIPAIFFINPAFIDNKELFYRCKLSLVLDKIRSDQQSTKKVGDYMGYKKSDYYALRNLILGIQYPNRFKADELGAITEIDFEEFLRKQQPFLTSDQIKKLQAQGFVFGGHSQDHPDYKFLNIAEQCEQTVKSTEFVNRFGQNYFAFFAFPHEDREVKQLFFDQMRQLASPYLFFGLQNQKTENQNHVLHRFNAERPEENLSRTTKTVLTFNFFLRLLNKQRIIRK